MRNQSICQSTIVCKSFIFYYYLIYKLNSHWRIVTHLVPKLSIRNPQNSINYFKRPCIRAQMLFMALFILCITGLFKSICLSPPETVLDVICDVTPAHSRVFKIPLIWVWMYLYRDVWVRIVRCALLTRTLVEQFKRIVLVSFSRRGEFHYRLLVNIFIVNKHKDDFKSYYFRNIFSDGFCLLYWNRWEHERIVILQRRLLKYIWLKS